MGRWQRPSNASSTYSNTKGKNRDPLVKELENNTTPFVYQKSCESFWPNNKYADEASLKWIGFILGCSFTSKCPLGISMPELFFKYLLDDHYRPTLEDVQSFNEEIYNAMVSIQKMDDGKYLEVLQADFYEDNMKRDEYIKVSTPFLINPGN